MRKHSIVAVELGRLPCKYEDLTLIQCFGSCCFSVAVVKHCDLGSV